MSVFLFGGLTNETRKLKCLGAFSNGHDGEWAVAKQERFIDCFQKEGLEFVAKVTNRSTSDIAMRRNDICKD